MKTIDGSFSTDNVPRLKYFLAKASVRARVVPYTPGERSAVHTVFFSEKTLDGKGFQDLVSELQKLEGVEEEEKQRKSGAVYSNFLTSGYEIISSLDPTPSTVFRNACMRERPAEKQLLNLMNYAKESKTQAFDKVEAFLTNAVRRNRQYALGKTKNPAVFRSEPLYCADDWYAIMLPRDNTVGEELFKQGKLKVTKDRCHIDYLGYHSEVWRDFIYDLADELKKECVSDLELDCIKLLLLDYSSNVPEASTIAHDGKFKLGDGVWDAADMQSFSEYLGRYWKAAVDRASSNPERYRIKLNGTKSVGCDGYHVNGDKYSPAESRWTVVGEPDIDSRVSFIKSLTPEQKNEYLTYMWARQDNSAFKLEWLPELKERARTFVKFSRKPVSMTSDFAKEYLEMLHQGLVPIHTISTRRNNGDVPIQTPKDGQSFRTLRHKWSKKDRDFRYEIEPCVWAIGVIDDLKYTQAYDQLRGGILGEAFLKVRPVFPGNNVTFYPPWIQMCRILMYDVEEGAGGFPSLHPPVRQKYERWYSRHKNTKIVTFDRRTAEQWITDNWENFIKLIPESLRCIFDRLGLVLCPSEFGPRVVNGGLFSGTAMTTLVNAIVGGFEMIRTISKLTSVPVKEVIPIYFDAVFNGLDEVTVGGVPMCISLGTDDQILLCEGEINPISEEYWDRLRLSGEICDDATVFGLHFTRDSFSVSECLGLYKVFLAEKERLGDAIALKYTKRLELLSKYRDIIQQCFTKHHFGSISDYAEGGNNYLNKVDEFGFSLTDLFNEYSASDTVIFGSGFDKYDPRLQDHYYPASLVTDVCELIKEEKLL